MKDANDSKTLELVLLPQLKEMGFRAFKLDPESASPLFRAIDADGKEHTFGNSVRMGRYFQKQLDQRANASAPPVGRGGKRANSGRKPLDQDGGSIITTVRLTGEQRATFDMLGGVVWLREQLQLVIQGQQ